MSNYQNNRPANNRPAGRFSPAVEEARKALMEFCPEAAPYLMDLQGKPYLQVQGRLIMFRKQHPKGSITTENCVSFLQMVEHGVSVFKATIKDGEGNVLGSAHGNEFPKGFPDFIGKAETTAVGRALLNAGVGLQFAGDSEDSVGKLADSPMPEAYRAPAADVSREVLEPVTEPVVVPAPPSRATLTQSDKLAPQKPTESPNIVLEPEIPVHPVNNRTRLVYDKSGENPEARKLALQNAYGAVGKYIAPHLKGKPFSENKEEFYDLVDSVLDRFGMTIMNPPSMSQLELVSKALESGAGPDGEVLRFE